VLSITTHALNRQRRLSCREVSLKSAYRILAFLIAAEVVVQAAAIAFAFFGLSKWIDGGGILDKATMESDEITFDEVAGFIVHGINGMMVMPLLALILLIVSFFAKVPGGSKWAGLVLLIVVIQVGLALFGREVSLLGLLHGANALILFAVAFHAGSRASASRERDAEAQYA